MVAQKYRWDFIGLSTDTKPTTLTSPKVVDGSTYYCSDTSKLYVWCKDQWYERKALGGGGGGGTTYTAGDGINITDDTISVDTSTIQAKLTAGTNVTISDNTISATDTTYSNFTGTDGIAAGTAGLVPAPATTDAGKFLKADGTWATAGGGGSDIKELTSADYDYPTESPDGIAIWKLPNGFYKFGNTAYVKLYIGKAYDGAVMESVNIISDFLNITGNGTVDTYIYARRFKGVYTVGSYTLEGISSVRVNKSTQVYDHSFAMGTTLEAKDVVDTGQLSSSIVTADSILPLSAGAGKTLAQRLVVGLTAAPDNSTHGVVGTIASSIESGSPHLYMCTAISGSSKTWAQLI